MAERRLPRFIRSLRFWKWVGIASAVTLALTLLGVLHWVPIQSGRVVDMRSGKPIEGAIVKRVFYMPSPPTLIDTPAPTTIPLTYRETRTGSDGTFAFDPIFFPRLAGMALLVFKPGMMPFTGCYVERSWRWGGCSGFGFLTDAWNQGKFTKSLTRLTIEVSIREPTMDGVRVEDWPFGEDWTELNPETMKHDLVKRFPDDVHPEELYFRKLNAFVRDLWLEPQVFVESAMKYVEDGGQITEEIWRYFNDHLLGSMSIEQCARMRFACERNGTALCSPEVSEALMKEQLTLEVCTRLKAGDVQGALNLFEQIGPASQQVREDVIPNSWYRTWGRKPLPPAGEELNKRELLHCQSLEVGCSDSYMQWLLGRK
ncbi:MAG: carboxypeptidase-like regulatory domain-containing protein [Acidobacteriota bacterium]